MKNILSGFQGDKAIWAFVILLAIISFMPVFSASTNLVHVIGTGTIIGILVKHSFHVFIGVLIIYIVHRIPFDRFKYVAPLLWIVAFILLLITAAQGFTIAGANASRWIKVPLINISFQPSSLGWIAIVSYLSWYLWRFEDESYSFKKSLFYIWLPILMIVLPIVPSNLSTAALIFASCCMLLFIGKYPMRYLGKIFMIGALLGTLFFFASKAFPDQMPSRFTTWVARLERFGSDDEDVDRYQINNAKIAIAKGEIFGVGPGKSVQKNFLPQSSSDFIYAIIVEEFGLIGGVTVLFFYVLLLFRFLVVSMKAPNSFGKYLVFGLGFSIIFQALINMGVAVEIFPTTGQPLPLISSGGTSLWMTCVSIGVILSVSRKEELVKQQLKENEKKQEIFKEMLAEQENKNNNEQEDDIAVNTLKNL